MDDIEEMKEQFEKLKNMSVEQQAEVVELKA